MESVCVCDAYLGASIVGPRRFVNVDRGGYDVGVMVIICLFDSSLNIYGCDCRARARLLV